MLTANPAGRDGESGAGRSVLIRGGEHRPGHPAVRPGSRVVASRDPASGQASELAGLEVVVRARTARPVRAGDRDHHRGPAWSPMGLGAWRARAKTVTGNRNPAPAHTGLSLSWPCWRSVRAACSLRPSTRRAGPVGISARRHKTPTSARVLIAWRKRDNARSSFSATRATARPVVPCCPTASSRNSTAETYR